MTKHVAMITAAMALAALGTAHAQSAPAEKPKAAPARAFVPPKTPWGEPDLQGLYSNKTITPLERPAQFANERELTDEQIADLESRAAARSASVCRSIADVRSGAPWRWRRRAADSGSWATSLLNADVSR